MANTSILKNTQMFSVAKAASQAIRPHGSILQVLFAAAPDAMDPSLDTSLAVETPEAFGEAGYEAQG